MFTHNKLLLYIPISLMLNNQPTIIARANYINSLKIAKAMPRLFVIIFCHNSRFRGPEPNTLFSEGHHVTTYRAVDLSGNAAQCDVNIILTGKYAYFGLIGADLR